MKNDSQKPKKEPNDPLIGDPRMKGRRWMIDPYWDDGKTLKKIGKMKKLNEFDKWTDTEHNDWDVSYREFYEHLTEEVTKLTGGVGDTTAPSNVNTKELSIGVQVEMEHTNDPKIATEIAMDHLTEDPEYYSKLVDAGLATEFKPSSNSGLGDPIQSFNDKARIVSSFAHELKHEYDEYKQKHINIDTRLDYMSARDAMGTIEPIGEFAFMLYYTSIIESLVRPTEIAAELGVLGITKKRIFRVSTK